MVKLKEKKYGLDLSNKKVRIVGRANLNGRELLDAIINVDLEKLDNYALDSESSLYFSVNEKDAIVKRVNIPDNKLLDLDRVARFELAGSLLEGESKYYLESYSLNNPNQRLAIAYNRKFIDGKIAFFKKIMTQPSGFKLRSLAMADAYLKYCHQEGGRLICLVDIDDNFGSFSFLKDKKTELTGMVCGNGSKETKKVTSDGIDRAFILDLITMLHFQLTTINNGGGSLPLSLIILTGESASEELAKEFEKSSGIKTALPKLKSDMFIGEAVDEAAKYLVSLGLTVNN